MLPETPYVLYMQLQHQGCAQQTFTVQNKPAAVAPKETITHHFFVSGIGQKKTVDAAKICGGAENVVKTETQQTFVNGLLGFITLGIYTPLEARDCIAHNNCMSCPSIWAALSTLLINILLGSFQLFLHSDQPLSGEIIPVQRCVCQSGEAALSTPEAGWLHALTDRLL
ncbi:lipoprotein bor [Caerostris darwini]|uniref:Lipoprotein bor n=1 Tax=Caerostris darwini TaxID=1538125 RepID=A0AAV4TEG1_9ARAC|nr:lipoprotein bor [Caerostris darwini]